MNATATTQIGGGLEARPRAFWSRGSGLPAATGFLLILVALLPLYRLLAFDTHAVLTGQWWRLLTHPFVHVSWYHALLDGAALLLLWRSLERRRLAHIILPAAGSLLAALWFWPAINQTGLCGLSGIAHGLMAISALEMIRRGDRLGWFCLALVTGKSIWEAATGQVFFSWLHFGLMGTPVAVSHLGGVVGGLLSWALGGRK
jgi:rhomboid family GlyGly-CTERM serine protease